MDFTRDYSSGDLASARWADPEYIAEKHEYQPGHIWLGRNPHNPDQAIGYKDDRHVFICAETRSGKGRALLVNNQVLWPGSLVTVGPKGEEATIAAPRRGDGNMYCDGMGQKVYVLDPMRSADVPEEHRAYFNFLDALDPEDGELVAQVDRLANAICTIPDAAEAAEWDKEGRALVALVILHVLTYQFIEDSERHILTVRDFVLEGNVKAAKMIESHLALEGKENEKVDAYLLLLKEMEKNTACDGAISRNARDLLKSAKDHMKYFESVRKSAAKHLRFLEGQGIRSVVCGPEAGGRFNRTFKIDDLKNETISVFLCLPEQDYDPLDRWLRGMIQLLLDGMRKKQGLPANGHQVLFSIDEFANLGKMEEIGKAINSIAGAGVKLMIAVQRLGDLQELYGKAWEKFIAGAGAQIWFGAEEVATCEYLEKKLGKTEITKVGRSINMGYGSSTAVGSTFSYSHTNSLSNSETVGQSTSYAKGQSSAKTKGGSRSKGKSKNYGSSQGSSANRNYGPHIFFESMENWFHSSTSDGSNNNKSKGRSSNTQESYNWGVTDTESFTETMGENLSATRQRGKSEASTVGESETETTNENRSASLNETYHVKPLLSISEAKQFLLSIPEMDHAAFPGFALITLADEPNPFFVRKSNHDQDPYLVGKFNPNPAHKFIPFDEQPLMGWQITENHFFTVAAPKGLLEEKYDFGIEQINVRQNQWVESGDTLFNYGHFNNNLCVENSVEIPIDGKVIAIHPTEIIEEKGAVLSFRANDPIVGSERFELHERVWSKALLFLKKEKKHLENEAFRQRSEREKEEAKRQTKEREEAERQEETRFREKQETNRKHKAVINRKIKPYQDAISYQNKLAAKFEEESHWAGFMMLVGLFGGMGSIWNENSSLTTLCLFIFVISSSLGNYDKFIGQLIIKYNKNKIDKILSENKI